MEKSLMEQDMLNILASYDDFLEQRNFKEADRMCDVMEEYDSEEAGKMREGIGKSIKETMEIKEKVQIYGERDSGIYDDIEEVVNFIRNNSGGIAVIPYLITAAADRVEAWLATRATRDL